MMWLAIAALWVQVSFSPMEYHEFTEDKFAVFTICGNPVLFVAEVSNKIALTTPKALRDDPAWARAWAAFVIQIHPKHRSKEYKMEKQHPEYIRCSESDEEAKWNPEPMGRKHVSGGSETI